MWKSLIREYHVQFYLFNTFKVKFNDRSLLYTIRMIDTIAREIHSQKCQRRVVERSWHRVQKERMWKRNVVLRAAARGIHIFFCRDLNLNGRYRRAIVPSLFRVCVGDPIRRNTRVENGLYRGERERVRSVLVPIGSRHQRFSSLREQIRRRNQWFFARTRQIRCVLCLRG